MDWAWSAWSELGRDDLHDVMVLRQRVFVVEQECAYQDADGRDPDAMHLLGRESGRVVAYLRVFPPGGPGVDPHDPGAVWIGRVVTDAEVRRTGVGRALMLEGLRWVGARWPEAPIRVSAQAYLERFYASLGFRVDGDGYDEDGIPHLPMVR